MLEIMRLTPQICCASKIIGETVRKKFTKADVIKRLMKEHKATFGSLLETKREKNRRLKLAKKGVLVSADSESTGNSELSWMLKVSDSRLRVVKINRENKPVVADASTRNISSNCTIDDDQLSNVQTRIIRKTSGTKAKVSEPEFIINSELDPSLKKKSLLPKAVKVKILRPPTSSVVDKQNLKKIDIKYKEKKNSASLQPQENIRENMNKLQLNEKCTVQKTVKSKISNPSESSVSPEQNINEIDIQKQEEETYSPILLPCDKIIESIDKAQLYYEEDENLDVDQSSEILSISRMQKEYSVLPSVTKILNATMSDNAKKILELWMARMIQQLGQEGFNEYKNDLLQNGKLLHSVIDSTLRKMPVEVPDNLQSCYSSIKTVLDEVENVRAIESQVVHQNLGYRGVVDCVASYRGNMCLIDWKKSDKTKHLLSSTYDAPLQIASYIGALNADKNYPFQIKSGLLVIAYTIGEPPTVFTLDQTKLKYYWKQWLGRLKKYYNMQNA